MKKIVPMMMALLMVMSVVMVAFVGGATITGEKHVEKVDQQQLFENKAADVSWNEEYAADEILVKFKSGVGKERIDKLNAKHGVSVRHTSSYSAPEGSYYQKVSQLLKWSCYIKLMMQLTMQNQTTLLMH